MSCVYVPFWSSGDQEKPIWNVLMAWCRLYTSWRQRATSESREFIKLTLRHGTRAKRNNWITEQLTHCCWVTHICVSTLGLLSFRSWHATKLLSEPMMAYCQWDHQHQSLNYDWNSNLFIVEMHFKISSSKLWWFCLCLTVLTNIRFPNREASGAKHIFLYINTYLYHFPWCICMLNKCQYIMWR